VASSPWATSASNAGGVAPDTVEIEELPLGTSQVLQDVVTGLCIEEGDGRAGPLAHGSCLEAELDLGLVPRQNPLVFAGRPFWLGLLAPQLRWAGRRVPL